MFDFLKPFYPLLLSTTSNNPEAAHSKLLEILSKIQNNRTWGKLIQKQLQKSFCYQNDALQQKIWHLQFPNPLGLAAGCDKDGVAAGIWGSLGFGFAELGAVTLHPQPGNPQPRLFRLKDDLAVLNRMGANNLGAATMAQTLKLAWLNHPRLIPIGINLCKSKITPLTEAAADYVGSFRYLQDYADYFVVNVSSPNTPGLRSLQTTEQLKPIFTALQAENNQNKPILIKIAPDLSWEEISAILDVVKEYNLAGIIATNTTIKRDNLKTKILATTGNLIEQEAGGISGKPVKERSTEIIRFIWQKTAGTVPIIGVGGIFTAEDAWEKIIAGASLLQVYTGWIYQGPWLVPSVLKGLNAKLAANNLTHISQAVGMEHQMVTNK